MMERTQEYSEKRAAINRSPGCAVFPCCQRRLLSIERSDRGQDTQSSCPGTGLSSVVNTKLSVDIACVGLDRVQ